MASIAHSGAMVSLAGLAVLQLPATVPRLRICGAPTSQQARARGRRRSRPQKCRPPDCAANAPRVSAPFLRSSRVEVSDA